MPQTLARVSDALLRAAVAERARRPVLSPTPTLVGISAAELAGRHRGSGTLSAEELRRWLLDGGLAIEQDGLLYVTKLGHEVGGAFA